MSIISITKRWELPINNRKYPKNDTKYKTEECDNSINRRPCKFQERGTCLFWHNESERDYWKYVRDTAKRRRLQPAEVDYEIKEQEKERKKKNLQKKIKTHRKNLAVSSKTREEKELPPNIKKTLELSGAFEGGRKKRTKKGKKRRRKRRTKKRKSRKRRRTKKK